MIDVVIKDLQGNIITEEKLLSTEITSEAYYRNMEMIDSRLKEEGGFDIG